MNEIETQPFTLLMGPLKILVQVFTIIEVDLIHAQSCRSNRLALSMVQMGFIKLREPKDVFK